MGSDKVASLDKALKIPGFMFHHELDWLYEQAREREIVVEIGVWKGRSTTALCEGCPGVVIAVDHFSGGADNEDASPAAARDQNVRAVAIANLQPYLDSGKLILVQTPSDRAYETLRKLFPGRFADMVFVDGDHRAEALKVDMQYRNLVKDGGLFCGHDYDWPSGSVVEATAPFKPIVDGRMWWSFVG